MNQNKQEIIRKIEVEYPEFITTRMLIDMEIGGHNSWHNERRRKRISCFQSKGKGGRLYYKKADIIQWIKRYYTPDVKAPKQEAIEAPKPSSFLHNFLSILGMK